MPTYSPDDDVYRQRVHANGRAPDPNFVAAEHLFRRYRKEHLINGKPVPLSIFPLDEPVSTNRSKFSEPQDVLEPDCCDGSERSGCVVLDINVSDIPEMLSTEDGTGRVFRFVVVHRPRNLCYPHTVIHCNENGDPEESHQEPPKHLRNKFRAELARKLAERDVLEFQPFSSGEVL